MKDAKKKERLTTLLSAIYDKDFEEHPVSMRRFLTDTDFLGFSTKEGRMVYPIWFDKLGILMDNPEMNLPILTGAIGCLGPDVKVSLLDGRELTIPEIIEEKKEGKQHWTYSYDTAREKIVPGKVVNAMLSGTDVDKIVEIELDNGEKIKCTHNHPFLLTSNEYRKAEELRSGDSLMPLYRQIGKKGYEFIGASKGQWKPTFHVVIEETYGDVPKGSSRHHKWDEEKKAFDKSNNNPDMLEVITSKKHRRLHGVKSPFKVISGFASKCAKKMWDEYWNGKDGKQHRKEASDRLKKRNKEGQAKKASDSRWSKNVEEQKQVLSETLTKRNNAGQAKRASQVRWSKEGACEHQRKKMKESWVSRKKDRETRICAAPDCDNTFEVIVTSKKKYCCSGHSGKGKRKRNHKVVSVKNCCKRINVYDLSIEKYHNFALTSGVFVHNTGKTSAAVWGVAYVMHIVLCLKDPWTYFKKVSAGQMAIVFFNLTKNLGNSKGYNLLQSYLLKSPWFCQRGRVVGSEDNPRIEFPIFEYVSGSPYAKGFGVQGHDIIAALMDEVDSPSESTKQRVRVLKAFEAGYRRFENRFVSNSEFDDKRLTIGKFFLVASKQEQLSFLNTFIAKMKNSRNVFIVDIPIWEAKTDAEYKGPKFPVMIGDLYTPSKVLGQDLESGFESNQKASESAVKNGFTVIHVPIEYLEAFQLDIVGALRDYAGISIAGMRKSKLFPSEKLLVDCYDPVKKDPVKKLTIEVGLQDDVNFAEYIDFSAIRIPRHVPRFIHVDIAFSGEGDALGLGMSCISGWTERVTEDLEKGGEMKVENLPIVETDFGMRIHARAGDKIPLSRVRMLIADLKKVYHFNIRLVTFDLALLSEESKQLLGRIGIECGALSLDKKPQIYRNFRALVHDKRWCCHRNEYLHFELANLEDDPDRNKIDHPDEVVDIEILEDGNTRDIVVKGSKDISDGVVGSVEDALNDSGAPPSKEFIDKVNELIPQVHKQDGIRSLLAIGGKPKDSLYKKEGDDVPKDRSTKFADIFKKSQKT